MSQDEIVQHWQHGARDALEAAEILHKNGKYGLALFHCHLAVEKALKAAYIKKHDQEAPPTHNLLLLTQNLHIAWSNEELQLLRKLTDYVIDARYDDPDWAKKQATEENSTQWITHARTFLSRLL